MWAFDSFVAQRGAECRRLGITFRPPKCTFSRGIFRIHLQTDKQRGLSAKSSIRVANIGQIMGL